MINAFVELVRQNQREGMVVAEIGVWDGETTQGWLPIVHANGGLGILVDHWKGNPTATSQHASSPERRADVINILGSRVATYRHRVLEGDSAEMAAQMADQSLDIVFIDADHRYSHVSKDILAWRPKVKLGGILCGHDCEDFTYDPAFIETDYNGKHHGVIKAVTELVPNAKLIGDGVWVSTVP